MIAGPGTETESARTAMAQRELGAGSLRRSLPSDVGPVGATVVESAIRRGGEVVTSDRPDIERLAAAARRRFAVIDL